MKRVLQFFYQSRFRKHFAFFILHSSFACAVAQATVSFFISAEALRDAEGNPMPITGSVALVSAGEDGSFSGPDAEQFATGDDVLLGRFDLTSTNIPGIVDTVVGPVSLPSETATGQALALYWFPDVSLDTSRPGTNASYGAYIPERGSAAASTWQVPLEGAAVSLTLFSIDSSVLIDTGDIESEVTQAKHKTGEASDNSALYAADTDLGNGWKLSSWLGYYNGTHAPWYYHQSLGWLYSLASRTEASTWFYMPNAGWMWTNAESWPNFWRNDTSSWYYYLAEDNDGYFYDFANKAWIQF